MGNDIEKLFYEDIREKRKAGSGSFHKKGKGVKHHMSGIKTPYDFMKAKEKRNLNGKVTTYNMYESLLNRQEFDQLNPEKQTDYMTRWRDMYPNDKIMESLDIKSPGSFQALLVRLNVPKKQKRAAKMEPRVSGTVSKREMSKSEEKLTPATLTKPDITIMNGLNLKYNGIYGSEQISKILTKLQLLVDGEENDFLLSISLQERT